MSHSAAASSGADLQPQPQRGALDVVTMNVGAKTYEKEFSRTILSNLQELAQEFRNKARAATIIIPVNLTCFRNVSHETFTFIRKW